ncbi:MAG TPA: multicopper oxidase domain-containing protein [Acidimicrobiia bacterium]|nr:multicopper oxidase domain-containing protein [Acidimicrobiia bacterium]
MTPTRDEARDLSPAGAFDKFLIVVAIMGAAVAILAAIVAFRGDGGGVAAGDVPTQTVNVSLTEFAVQGDFEIESGPTRFEVSNDGSVVHNLMLEGGPSTPDLNAGATASLDVGSLSPGSYVIFCSIAGHREAGMEAALTVMEGAGGGEASGQEGHQGDDVDWANLDRMMTESMLAFPAETEGRGNQLLEPEILADGTKEFHLTAAITPWEVSPGNVVDAWSYNGMVPGPMIRVDVGDQVRVVLDNQLPMGTDIHWHGVATPNDMDGVAPLTQPLIESGETFVYEFEARRPAIGMYHPHHHAQMQVPNGLFALIIIGETPIPRGQTVSGIEIPEDMEIAQEIPMVLNDAGVIGLSLNGKSFPATEPYVGKVGDWVVAHYYNEGLQIHPMHQHQFPQLVFAKDGIPLDHPYWADTVNVAPGERYSVLYQLSDPGVWVWHCHILTHVEREEGMFGMVTAWIVEE